MLDEDSDLKVSRNEVKNMLSDNLNSICRPYREQIVKRLAEREVQDDSTSDALAKFHQQFDDYNDGVVVVQDAEKVASTIDVNNNLKIDKRELQKYFDQKTMKIMCLEEALRNPQIEF